MKTIEQTRRELFEAWLREGQCAGCVSDMWLGFNAALDAVVIELPEDPYGAHGMRYPTYTDAIQDCRSAIESTNLGLKTI